MWEFYQIQSFTLSLNPLSKRVFESSNAVCIHMDVREVQQRRRRHNDDDNCNDCGSVMQRKRYYNLFHVNMEVKVVIMEVQEGKKYFYEVQKYHFPNQHQFSLNLPEEYACLTYPPIFQGFI